MPPSDTDDRDFGAILAEFESQQPAPAPGGAPETGDKVSGAIISIGEDAAFVDLGGKSEGVVRLEELRDDEGELTVGVGDTIEAMVAGTDDAGGLLLRVRPGHVAGGEEARRELARAHELEMPVEGMVSGVVKGGVEVQVAGLRAFCPISQLDLHYVEDPTTWVGRNLSFRILRFEDPGPGRAPNLVLSRKAVLAEEARQRAEETRAKLKEGAVVEGTVTSLTGYGAFVDLGGLEGLLHVSEISYSRVEDPADVLAVGDRLEVKVLRIEPGRGGRGGSDRGERISLSRKALESDPWGDAERRFTAGSTHRGRVARMETFGAFVELAPGIDGLLHVSELAQSELGGGRRLAHAREVLELGQELEVRVNSFDRERRRISLGLAASIETGGSYSSDPGGAAGLGSLGDIFKRLGGDEDGG